MKINNLTIWILVWLNNILDIIIINTLGILERYSFPEIPTICLIFFVAKFYSKRQNLILDGIYLALTEWFRYFVYKACVY